MGSCDGDEMAVVAVGWGQKMWMPRVMAMPARAAILETRKVAHCHQ